MIFRTFTLEEYHRMVRAGIFDEGGSVELLEGWIVKKWKGNRYHDGVAHLFPCGIVMEATPMWVSGPLPLLRKFTLAEYHRAARANAFADGDPVEFLEGCIVKKTSRSPIQNSVCQKIWSALTGLLPSRWELFSQLAVTMADSEPEPDFAVVRGPMARPPLRHPGPAETGLLIEVADTTLQHDRTVKGRIYARAGVGEYWIVNLNDAQVEVYTQPSGDGAAPAYQQLQTFRAGQAVPLILDGQQLAALPVQDLLP